MKRLKPDFGLNLHHQAQCIWGNLCRVPENPLYFPPYRNREPHFQKTGMVLKLITLMYRMGLKKAQCVFFFRIRIIKTYLNPWALQGRTRLVNGSGVNLKRHRMSLIPKVILISCIIGRIMKEREWMNSWKRQGSLQGNGFISRYWVEFDGIMRKGL